MKPDDKSLSTADLARAGAAASRSRENPAPASDVTTEELRIALQKYRSLFERLLAA